MAPLDVGHWLEPVSEDQPAGPNLEFDPDFGALERAAQGKPEQQVGATLIPAEPPDWTEVQTQATALLERTRDLRVAAHLAVARLHLSGLPGYGAVLGIIRELLQTRWPDVHPQLDPDDDHDPTLRANALLRLADPARVMRALRDLPLAVSQRAGRVSWRDIAVATGAIEPEAGREKSTEAVIRGAFADSDAARLADLRAVARQAVSDIAAIPSAFDTQSGFGTGPDFTDLAKLLREIDGHLTRFAPTVAPEPLPDEAAETPPDATGAPAATPTAATASAPLTEIRSRAEAVRALQLVLRYYERYEPSSPLPLLIERAARLADKGFLDILRDLAPDGLGQAQAIAGAASE